MTYIPRREITALIPNKFEAIRVLALECRRLNEEIRAREDSEVEGKLTTLAVKQMLEGKVTYYDAKERREQERSEAMLSAAEGLLDIAEPMIEPEFSESLDEDGAGVEAIEDPDAATAESSEAPGDESAEPVEAAEAATAETAPAEAESAVAVVEDASDSPDAPAAPAEVEVAVPVTDETDTETEEKDKPGD